MAKKTLEDSSDNFEQFSGVAPDLKRRDERNLIDELHKKNWQAKTVDNFEKSMGITPGPPEKQKMLMKNRIFEPGYDKDQELLNELMNSPKYRIVYQKDNWSPDGSYKIFIIYGELLEDK